MVNSLSEDKYCKHFTAWRQFLTLLYAQISGKGSLREVETGLFANKHLLYHLGMEAVARSTLSEAMNQRDPAIFEAIFNEMLDRVLLLTPKHKFRFHNPLYVIDSTTIPLCLSQYDWALYRKQKGAIKLHAELKLGGNILCFVKMTNGKISDIRAAKENIAIVPDSIYTLDKGYYDFGWFWEIDDQGAFFVTRIKNNAQIEFVGQHREPNTKQGILRDEIIRYTTYQATRKYPKTLRFIEYQDEKTGKIYQFITNNLTIVASSIAEICHQRWQIELFFKWIKQNLKIKSFLGTTENAVMSQIYVAMIHYLLVAYIGFLNHNRQTLTEITRRLKETLMQRFSLLEILFIDRQIIAKSPNFDTESIQPELFPLFSS